MRRQTGNIALPRTRRCRLAMNSDPTRGEPREHLGGDLLELPLGVLVVADGVHDEVGAAGVHEALELLRALRRRPDDAVAAGEGPEVLRVALAEQAHPGVARALVVVADGDEGEVRVDEAVERAPGLRRLLADLRHGLPVALGVDHVRHPPVALARRPRQRRVGPPADPDGRPRLLHRLGVDADAVEAGEAAVERRRRVAPERAHDVDALGHARAALLVRDAADLELLAVLAAHAHAEDEAAAGQHVQGGRGLGRDGGRAQREQVHAGAEADARGDARVAREERQRLEDRVVEGDVVAGPDRLEAQLLDAAHEAELLLRRTRRRRRRRGAEVDRGHGRQGITRATC